MENEREVTEQRNKQREKRKKYKVEKVPVRG